MLRKLSQGMAILRFFFLNDEISMKILGAQNQRHHEEILLKAWIHRKHQGGRF